MAKACVLCFDGTYNQIGLEGTNVLRLYESLICDPTQVVFYDPGVGTLTDPNSLTKVRRLLRQAIDLATGLSLRDNFIDGYTFLMRHYAPGDSIYLFGFSRGAYTAKALAGALHMFGLLRPEHENLVPYVWQTYSDQKPDMTRVSELYRLRFSHDADGQTESTEHTRKVKVRMLGIWDAVSSFGLFWDFKTLRFTRRNPSVQIVRHALALDERRGLFKANHCERIGTQDLKEVWFAGYHSDVGGHPFSRPELSDIAFRWMVGEAQLAGLRFDRDRLAQVPLLIPSDPRPSMHDSMDWYWRLAEFLPILGYSASRRKRVLRGPNLFRRRPVRATESIHETVAHWLESGVYRAPNVPPEMRIAKTAAIAR